MAELLVAIIIVLVLVINALLRHEESVTEEFYCGCGHHLCFHDENGCGDRDEEDGWQNCNCKRYIGPLPIDDQLKGLEIGREP